MKIRICNECENPMKRCTNLLANDGIYEVAHYCATCNIYYQEKYNTINDGGDLDFYEMLQRIQTATFNSQDDAESFLQEVNDFIGRVNDMVFDLDSLEIDANEEIFNRYGMRL